MLDYTIGNYQIQSLVGEGGMGTVFKGFDLMLEREVAIKVLRPELARQPQLVERFRAEAVTLARVNHPYVATLHTLLRHGEDFLMVMEFVRGKTLDAVIRQSGAMDIERAVRLFCQALEGIAHALQILCLAHGGSPDAPCAIFVTPQWTARNCNHAPTAVSAPLCETGDLNSAGPA